MHKRGGLNAELKIRSIERSGQYLNSKSKKGDSMRLKKLFTQFGDAEKQLESFDKENPDGILLFNPSFSEIQETLNKHKKNFLKKYEEVSAQIEAMDDKLSDLVALSSRLEQRIDSINSELDWIEKQLKEIKSESIEQEAFKEIQDEAQRYRQDWFRSKLSGTVKKLIRLYDDLEYLDQSEGTSALREDILTILKTRNIEKITVNNEEFDPEYMKAIEVKEVDEDEKDMMIKEVKKEGFEYEDGKTIRPVEVIITRST